MKAVQQEGRGVIVYLRQEGRGIGLINKIRAYKLQDEGMDTVEANLALGLPVDARDFTLAKQIYDHLNIRAVKLLTNNPEKIQTLKDAGINVVERIPLHVGENVENERYLHTKADKLGHIFLIEGRRAYFPPFFVFRRPFPNPYPDIVIIRAVRTTTDLYPYEHLHPPRHTSLSANSG